MGPSGRVDAAVPTWEGEMPSCAVPWAGVSNEASSGLAHGGGVGSDGLNFDLLARTPWYRTRLA
jgi:hypothetical protein